MKWIKVSERLPEKDNSLVIAVFEWGGSLIVNGDIEYYKNKFYWNCERGSDQVNVTHWMPLPEVPKDDKGNECPKCKFSFLPDDGDWGKMKTLGYCRCSVKDDE